MTGRTRNYPKSEITGLQNENDRQLIGIQFSVIYWLTGVKNEQTVVFAIPTFE